MNKDTRGELLSALRDIELTSEDFKSAFALMYAYLTGTEEQVDTDLAEAFESAHDAIVYRQIQKVLKKHTVH
jgi:hypothetical protein